MKITDLKCAVFGQNPVVRITTDEGIDGLGQVEASKSYLKPHIMWYKQFIVGEDPRDVMRVMRKIRRLGGHKPWGSAVSAIEMALWDIAGKAAGLPVYRLLGGKLRDRVRVYNTGGYGQALKGTRPEDYAEYVAQIKEAPEGFSFIKMGISFHSGMATSMPKFAFGEMRQDYGHPNRAPLTPQGFKYVVDCVTAMKEALGDKIGLAVDCGPGWMVPDAIRFARAVEPLNLMWMEDLITGDYYPYSMVDAFREVTQSTTTPTHTGEQLYLRNNFVELIERQAVRIVGPDPCDVGGIAELKWVAEYADLHGILMAPHGVGDGVIGLAALVHMAATLPENYIAFEYPMGRPEWWYDIVEGLPDPIVRESEIAVWDRPGMGVSFNVKAAKKYLREEDEGFFD